MTQDSMDAIAKDATTMMTLARKYLPMEDPDADGMVRALEDARGAASRRTRVEVADLRTSADADTVARIIHLRMPKTDLGPTLPAAC